MCEKRRGGSIYSPWLDGGEGGGIKILRENKAKVGKINTAPHYPPPTNTHAQYSLHIVQYSTHASHNFYCVVLMGEGRGGGRMSWECTVYLLAGIEITSGCIREWDRYEMDQRESGEGYRRDHLCNSSVIQGLVRPRRSIIGENCSNPTVTLTPQHPPPPHFQLSFDDIHTEPLFEKNEGRYE